MMILIFMLFVLFDIIVYILKMDDNPLLRASDKEYKRRFD